MCNSGGAIIFIHLFVMMLQSPISNQSKNKYPSWAKPGEGGHPHPMVVACCPLWLQASTISADSSSFRLSQKNQLGCAALNICKLVRKWKSERKKKETYFDTFGTSQLIRGMQRQCRSIGRIFHVVKSICQLKSCPERHREPNTHGILKKWIYGNAFWCFGCVLYYKLLF